MHAPDPHPRPPAPAAAMQRLGLCRPAGGWWGWWRDAHAVAAVAATVPVCGLLALGWGDRMAVPVGGLAWAVFLLAQPLIEELAFRGALHGALDQALARRRLAGRPCLPSLANALTSVAFVLLHLLHQPWTWALAVFLPSLVLGHLRERLGSVWPAVGVHAVYNGGFGVAACWAQAAC